MTFKLLILVTFAALTAFTALDLAGPQNDLLVDGPAVEFKLARS